MSYPTLEQIQGQARAVETLDAAVASERVHHAWIFHGPSGVGKQTTARAFAGVLLDPGAGPDLSGRIRPDPEGRTRALLESGSHPDLHLISKEMASFSREQSVRSSKQRSIPVEVIREFLIEPAGLSTAASNGARASKVFIVDEAHLLQAGEGAAANAVLKVLEEPPAGVVIILVTDDEHALLPTIRSRCRRVAFGPLDEGAMKAWLKGSGVEVPRGRAADLLEYAGGSPGRLMLALDADVAGWMDRLDPLLEQAWKGRYAPELAGAMHEIVKGYAEAKAKESSEASKDVANRLALDLLFSLLHARVRGRVRATAGDRERSRRPLRDVEAIDTAERLVGSNANAGLALENLALQLSRA